jgi:DNA-binding transcriptional MerR regulator
LTLQCTLRSTLPTMSLTVSHLGAEVGLSAATVRYYERLGPLPPPERTSAGYRQYPKEAVDRLRLIKSAQHLGLRLREIGELLTICDQGLCPCGHGEALLHARISPATPARPCAPSSSRAGA